MSTTIELRKYEVLDFISVESGREAITMTLFRGNVQIGTPGWANEWQLSPDQADALADELKRRARAMRQVVTVFSTPENAKPPTSLAQLAGSGLTVC